MTSARAAAFQAAAGDEAGWFWTSREIIAREITAPLTLIGAFGAAVTGWAEQDDMTDIPGWVACRCGCAVQRRVARTGAGTAPWPARGRFLVRTIW